MSSSILSSQGMAMALAALSGTVILLSFCFRPSISSVGRRKEMEKKKKRRKRVHFAEDVIITEELQRKKGLILCSSSPADRASPPCLKSDGRGGGGMPANRVALYNGILRNRLVHRMAYSV